MVRIGFAGFRHGHVNCLYKFAEENPDVEIKGAWEENPEARSAVEKELGVKFTYDSYEDMLKDDSIDVITIGDYFGRRGMLAIKALNAGKHVYADKPLCISLSELEQIERLSSEKNLKVGLMLDMRQEKFVQPVRDLLKENVLGEIHNIFSAQHPHVWHKAILVLRGRQARRND